MALRQKQQRGVAIIVALLTVTLATILATNLLWDIQLDQRRTGTMLATDQSLLYALGAEAWVADILRDDQQQSGPDVDHLGELWAQPVPPLPVDGGELTGALEDLQGRFNLNNLLNGQGALDEISRAQFERLLLVLELEPRLANLVADWLDFNSQAGFPEGAEDDVYTARVPPYRTANLPITSASELLAIEGVDAESYWILRPHVTALPVGTRLNVNTATSAVLRSLSDNISNSDAESLHLERSELGFEDVESVFADLVDEDTLGRLVLSSEYFQLNTRVAIGTTQLSMYSVLHRDNSGVVHTMVRRLGAE